MTKARHPKADPPPPARPASILDRLFAPVDIAWLAFLRVAYGAIMLWEVERYFSHDWIRTYWMRPDFHFGYFGFEWVKPWPGEWMLVHFAVMGVLALCILFGLFYRVAAFLFFLAFSYVFLLEEARYLNHFYLLSLIAFLMALLPAHRAFSLDAGRNATLRSGTVPAWMLWLMRFQVGVPYFFGGIAKLNSDWLRAVPLDSWLAERSHFPVIGPFLDERPVAFLFSYGGLFLDLFIVPLLLWRRTRVWAFLGGAIFHLMNDWIFTIGIFPWFMLAATTVFFEPDWPRRLWAAIGGEKLKALPASAPARPVVRRSVAAFLGAWVLVQVALPLRHFLYPGEVSWTEEGHRFSWHMKLREKAGEAMFTVTDPTTGETETVDPLERLPRWQARIVATHPDMLLQFSHMLAAERERKGRVRPEVRARALCSLNGRPRSDLIDSNVDLAAQKRSLLPSSWILPLKEELPIAGRNDEAGPSED